MNARLSLATLLICALIVAGWPLVGQANTTSAATVRTFTAQEYVRNGSFDANATGWSIGPNTWSYIDGGAGQDGGPALRLSHGIDDGPGLGVQMLHLPTTISQANLRYNVRIQPGQQPAGSTAVFGTQIVDGTDVLFEDAYQISAGVNWTPIDVTLPGDAIAKIQASYDAGKQIYLRFVLVNGQGAFFTAFVDDVSLLVDGAMAYPNLTGAIGFLSKQGQQPTVERIQPDGSGRQLLWTHPSTIAPDLYAVAWQPDGKGIAFSSNHEGAYSIFHSDIYAVAPDGSGLRRISNPPMHANWPHGRQTGTITGRIQNAHASFGYSFFVYVDGAQELVNVALPEFGQSVDFTIPNVADGGDGVGQTIVFNWSRGNCANAKEFSVPVDVLPGQTVDVGTITFQGLCNTYDVLDLSWKSDGSDIAALLLSGSRRFAGSGESVGRSLFNGAENFPQDLAWSPVNDQVLSTRLTQATTDGIFLGTASGDPGSQIAIDSQSNQQNPAWLPGGDGFVFTFNSNTIGRANVNGQQATPLVTFFNETVDNLTVSPDGNYAAFERGNAQGIVNVWIVNLARPNQMWPLTTDGVSRHPDWSRTDPTMPAQPTATPTSVPPTNTPTSPPNATNTPTSVPPTNTPTPPPNATNTPTPVPPTNTPTPQPGATNTPTSVPPTNTPTPQPGATNTPTPQPGATNTPTPVPPTDLDNKVYIPSVHR